MRAGELVIRARRAYYGWLIVGIVFLGTALSVGSSSYAFGLFLKPLELAFEWPRAAINASLSFVAVGSIAAPLLGRAMDRHGARAVLVPSVAAMGVSFLLRPLMSELWHWYALSLLQFVCFAGIGGLPAGRLVAIWFPRSRGRVMGITMMGNNFGGATVPLIVWLMLANRSWQSAFLVLGAIAMTIATLALLLVHENPRLGAAGPTQAVGDEVPTGPALTGWTVREALGTRSFYAIALALALATFTYSGILPWISAHLANEGMPAHLVVRAVTTLAVFGMMGKLGFGYLAERITARRAMMISVGGQGVFISLLVAFPSPPLAWVEVALFGLCMGAFGVLSTLVVQEAFGVRFFGSISGLINVATVASFVAGPLLAGASFQLTQSYGPGFFAVAAMFAVAIVALTQAKAAPRPPSARST